MMRLLRKSSLSILIGSVLLLCATTKGGTQSIPSSEKHETPATISTENTNQKNQSALYAALIEALRAITDQEIATAEQTRAENKSWLTPLRIQKGLLIVGIAYSVFALLQWLAIKDQATISRKALVSQQRPRIQIRSIPPPGEIIQVGMQAFFVTIVNRGGTTAKITESNCTARLDASPDIPIEVGVKQAGPPYSDERASFKKETLKRGDHCIAVATYRGHEGTDQGAFSDLRNDRKFFYVFGYVKYLDESGLPHEMTFCRRLDRPRGIFVPVNNPDYEYDE